MTSCSACRVLLLVLGMNVSVTGSALATENPTEADLAVAIDGYRTVGAEQVLPEFKRLHSAFQTLGEEALATRAERYIGESHWRLGDFGLARTHLEGALETMQRLGLRLDEGKTLNVLGLLEWDLGHYDRAIANFTHASGIGEELGHKRLAGSTLNNLSLVYDELGDYQTSLQQYQKALELYEGADFPRGESDTLGNIGGVYLLLGRYEEARDHYHRALSISEELQSTASMSLDHGNLGLCYLGLGQVDTALAHFDLALELARDAGMRKEEALWLRGQGNAMIHLGQYDLGLEHHRASLAIYEEIEARGQLLDALHDMGRLHLRLGDPVSAEGYFQRGIQLAREIGREQAITINLLALGDLRFLREQYEDAEALYLQALDRASAAGELGHQVESLLLLSAIHRNQRRFAKAEAEARRALAVAEQISAGFEMAEAWFALGESALHQGQPRAALEHYATVHAISGEHIDPDLLWRTHYGQALARIELEEHDLAISELESAAQVIESVRERLREERFKAGYIQDKYQVYVTLVRLQLELGRNRDAFSTAERLRARSFLDQLERSGPITTGKADRQREIALRERVKQLQRALAEEEEQLPANRRQHAINTFSGELLIAEREYQAYIDDIQARKTFAEVARKPSLPDLQSRLGPDEALVEYVVGEDRVMMFVMQSGNLEAVIERFPNSNLQSKIYLLRELTQDPSNGSWLAPAASLSQALIQPLRQRGLLEGVGHLYLVPHGILNYLPFAMLPLGEDGNDSVLMEPYTLTYLPAAAALLSPARGDSASKALLAMAPDRARLRYALEEARSIHELYGTSSQLLSGREATESAFKAQAGHFRVLHLSTHGFFNVSNPMLSGLELEPDTKNDGRLEVHEILGLSLNAGLVTLSACETGLGSGYFDELPAGDDFVSLTRAFLVAGSRSVLATLWEVDDRSTVQLMEGFYSLLSEDNAAPDQAQALASVQRKLRISERYNHPFYWAPFVLVGQRGRTGRAPQLATRG